MAVAQYMSTNLRKAKWCNSFNTCIKHAGIINMLQKSLIRVIVCYYKCVERPSKIKVQPCPRFIWLSKTQDVELEELHLDTAADRGCVGLTRHSIS